MKEYRFSLYYWDGEELNAEIPYGFDSISDAAKWCNKNDVPLTVVWICECDLGGPRDAYGCPEIVAQVTLQGPVDDGVEDLSSYVTY